MFLSLWRGAKGITRGQLRPWLGAVARNRTTDAMRRKQVFVPLEDDTPVLLGELWERMYETQRCEAVQKALLALSDEDREIFYRFYDLAQTTAQIAEDLHLNASTVRSRLLRGRQTLRKQLCIIQEFVPGKQVTLAHVISNPDEGLYKKMGVIGAASGALGIMTITPSEAAIIGADVASKAANISVVFVDRFSGSLVINGDVASVEEAIRDVLRVLTEVLRFTPTEITRT